MKKTIKGFLAGVITASMVIVPLVSFAETTSTITAIFDRIKLVVNGEEVSTQTILYNGTTFVPIRAVSENLGAKVVYDQKTQTANISLDKENDSDKGVEFLSSDWEIGTYDIVENSQTVADDPVRLEVSNVKSGSFDFVLSNENGEKVVSGTATVTGNTASFADTDIHVIRFDLEDNQIKITDAKGLTIVSGEAVFKKTAAKTATAPGPVVKDNIEWNNGKYVTYNSESDAFILEISNAKDSKFDFEFYTRDSDLIYEGSAEIKDGTAKCVLSDIYNISFTLNGDGIDVEESKANMLAGLTHFAFKG